MNRVLNVLRGGSTSKVNQDFGSNFDFFLKMDQKSVGLHPQRSCWLQDVLDMVDFLRRRWTDDCYHCSKRLSIDSDLSQKRR